MHHVHASAAGRPLSAPSARAIASSPLHLGHVEGVLNNLAASITAPLIIPLAVALGATGWEIGIVTALPLLAQNLSQVPAAKLTSRLGRPWLYMLATGLVGRLAWLGLAAALLSGRGSLGLVLALGTVASAASGTQIPLWTAFLGNAVPRERRGSYFGIRNSLAGAGGLAGAFGAASASSALGFERGSGAALLVAVVASSLAVGAACLALRAAGPSGSPSREVAANRPASEWRTRAVRDYAVYGALLILGAGMATPYYPVRFMDYLRGSPETATTAIAVAGALVMLGQGPFGWAVDRLGFRVVGALSLGGIALVPALWLAAAEPAHGVAIWLLNGALWAGCGLATFSLMLEVSDESNRASVVAWVNALQSPVNFGAPLLGGLIATALGLPVLFGLATLSLGASWVVFVRAAPCGREAVAGRFGRGGASC